jgi:hypothetical protein
VGPTAGEARWPVGPCGPAILLPAFPPPPRRQPLVGSAVVFLRCPWRRRSRHAASPSPPAASLLARPPAPRASPRISSSVASLAAGSAAPRHRWFIPHQLCPVRLCRRWWLVVRVTLFGCRSMQRRWRRGRAGSTGPLSRTTSSSPSSGARWWRRVPLHPPIPYFLPPVSWCQTVLLVFFETLEGPSF